MVYRIVPLTVLFGLVCLISQAASAADPPKAQALVARLSSPDPSVVRDAAREVQTYLESDPVHAVGYLRRIWLKPLQDAQKFDLVESLSLRGILAVPFSTGDVESLQETRVRAFLAAGKSQEALSQAKSLFNVTAMRNTEKALLLLSDCYSAAYPDDTQILRQLARQQIMGAATQPVSDRAADRGLLSTIRVDGAAYEKAIQQLTSDDDRTSLAKGNLLLLANRQEEATNVFEELLHKTGAADHIGFHENIARAIRAKDGSIGRANGYLMALPPEER